MSVLVTQASGFASNFEFSTCTIYAHKIKQLTDRNFTYIQEQNYDFSFQHKALEGPISIRPRPPRSKGCQHQLFIQHKFITLNNISTLSRIQVSKYQVKDIYSNIKISASVK